MEKLAYILKKAIKVRKEAVYQKQHRVYVLIIEGKKLVNIKIYYKDITEYILFEEIKSCTRLGILYSKT